MGCPGRRRGLGGAFGIVLLLYSACLILPVASQKRLIINEQPREKMGDVRRDVYCVHVGQHDEKGPYTIGGELMRPKDRIPLRIIATHWLVKERIRDGIYIYPITWENRWIKGQHFLQPDCPSPNYECPDRYSFQWENIHKAYVEYCPGDVEIRAYLVKQHGRVLKGWLHFEVEMTNDEMEYVLIQMRDENQNFVGEFVTEEDEQCRTPNSKSSLVYPTKYQVLPCSAVGLVEAKVSNSIFMANTDALENGPYLEQKGFIRSGKIGKGVHFNWRLNEYWCNLHYRFKLEAFVWSTKSKNNKKGSACGPKNKECRLKKRVTEFWIHPRWIGAADVKLPGDLNCSVEAIDFKNGAVTNVNGSWIETSSRLRYCDDILGNYTHHGGAYNQTIGCQVDVYESGGPPFDYTKVRSFGGRCNHVYLKRSSKDYRHDCQVPKQDGKTPTLIRHQNLTHWTKLNFESYMNYSESLHIARLQLCDQTCVVPNISNPQDLKDIKSFPRGNRSEISKNRKPKIVLKTLLKSRHEVRATTFWQTRKFHGSLCIFLTLFLIPISNFFIRYYKETFMHSRGLGCAPWFWFHLFVCFAVPILLWCSYSAMTQNIHTFGRSTSGAAVFHRVLGRVFVTGFILMICLGGLRPVQTHLRLLCMALHSVVGFAIYIIGIVLIVTSAYIPSSPSLDYCNDKGLPDGFSFTAIMALAWLGIDFLFHALLTILQFVMDRRYGIKRAGCGLPFVPILPAISPYSRADMVGSRLRKVVLLLYVILAAIITYLTIAELFGKEFKEHEHCSLGELTCNLSETRPNKASSPFGCSAFAIKYYASVYTKYDLQD